MPCYDDGIRVSGCYTMPEAAKPKTLRGRYQIKNNIFVTCYMDVEEASDNEFRTFISLKKRYDTMVPVGTKLMLNAESINKINARRSGSYDIFSVTVTGLELVDGKPLHICTPIQKTTYPNRRSRERRPTEFSLHLNGVPEGKFLVQNGALSEEGSPGGLKLRYQSKKAVLSVKLEQVCKFKVMYKGEEYVFSSSIKHIQYDWKRHDHEMGIEFVSTDDDIEFILNKLIDPEYTVQLSKRTSIDTAAGKISGL
jgi:hypothetical protein